MSSTDDGKFEGNNGGARQLSSTNFLIIVAALTLAASAIGFLTGMQLISSAEEGVRSKATEGPPPMIGASLQAAKSGNLKVMTPIVTNLAGSPPVWIRIESSLVFDEIPSDVDTLAAHIAEDIIGYLRTVSMSQIEGANGFQHLSEDLNERARVRSDGRARELVIQGLIIE